jgi:hypothetical protein
MKIAVRGKSAATRVTTSSTSAAPPPTHADAGGWREWAGGQPQVAHEGPTVVAVRPVGRVEREGGQVAHGGGTERALDEAIWRAVRARVEELVLLEAQPRVDVDEAFDPGHTRVGGQAPRVVV